MTTVIEDEWRVEVSDEHGVVDTITQPNGDETSHWMQWHRTPDRVREAVVDEVDDASHVEDVCPVHSFAR